MACSTRLAYGNTHTKDTIDSLDSGERNRRKERWTKSFGLEKTRLKGYRPSDKVWKAVSKAAFGQRIKRLTKN